MFQKILVATGGSPWSRHAVDTAIRFATNLQAELFIIHIIEDDPRYQPQELTFSDPQLRAESEETGREILTQAIARATSTGISPQTILEWGEIPEQIVYNADMRQCDLIVMGTRHLTGEKRLMTGRICNAVIATSLCPVLVVPLAQ